GLGQVVKANPHIASGRTGEVCPPNTLMFLREIGVVAVGVAYLCIDPLDLRSVWINVEPNFLAQGVQVFLFDHDNPHVLRGLRPIAHWLLFVCHCCGPFHCCETLWGKRSKERCAGSSLTSACAQARPPFAGSSSLRLPARTWMRGILRELTHFLLIAAVLPGRAGSAR